MHIVVDYQRYVKLVNKKDGSFILSIPYSLVEQAGIKEPKNKTIICKRYPAKKNKIVVELYVK